MPCTINGSPSSSQRAARWKLTDDSTSSADPISLNWLVPVECIIEQFSIHWNTAPVTSQSFELKRDAVDGAQYDCVFRKEDPSIEPFTDFVCNEPWRFSPGDRILFTYANTDNRTVGLTVWVVQVDN